MALAGPYKGRGVTLYRCDSCDYVGLWASRDFRHWGSIEQLEDGEGKHYCSDDCLVAKEGKKALKMVHPDFLVL